VYDGKTPAFSLTCHPPFKETLCVVSVLVFEIPEPVSSDQVTWDLKGTRETRYS
jgi:hypothetical protein